MYYANFRLKNRHDFTEVMAYLENKIEVSVSFDRKESQVSITIKSSELRSFERIFSRLNSKYGLSEFIVLRRETTSSNPIVLSFRTSRHDVPSIPLWLVKTKAHHEFCLSFMNDFGGES